MYIRRKVFSLLQDENGDERYFSTTDYTMEYDGDEVRYFANTEEDEKKAKRKKIAKKVAIGAGITAGAAGLAYGASKLTQRQIAKKATAISDAIDSGNLDENETQKAYEKLGKLFRGERVAKKISNPIDAAGRGIAKGAKAAYEGTKKGGKAAVEGMKKAGKATADAAKKGAKTVKDTSEKVYENAKETVKKVTSRKKNKE